MSWRLHPAITIYHLHNSQFIILHICTWGGCGSNWSTAQPCSASEIRIPRDPNPRSIMTHDIPRCTVSQAIPHPVRPVRTSVASRQVPPLVAGENDLRVQALHHLSQEMVKCCQNKLSRFCNILCIYLSVYSACSAVSDKSIPWNTPKGQRCRRSQESPPALVPSNDFAAWIFLLETSNNMASIWEDNGRYWILTSQSRVSRVLLNLVSRQNSRVFPDNAIAPSAGMFFQQLLTVSTSAKVNSVCGRLVIPYPQLATVRDVIKLVKTCMKMHEMWPLVATCNSCGKIIKPSSSQWGLSLARRIGVHSQLFSTVAASQLLFGTVSSALATKTLSMGWANKGCKTKSKHGGHGFMEDARLVLPSLPNSIHLLCVLSS